MIDSLEALAEDTGESQPVRKRLHLIVSTVPFSAGIVVPPSLLENKPVVMDVVYRPARTPLIQQVS